jgi:hypothetical protein
MSEKDLINPQRPAAEPPVKPTGVIKNKLLSILSDKPVQYELALEAYAVAPGVKGETLLDATSNNGDTGKMEEIEGPLPAHFENILRPFKRGDEYFLRRPEQHELIYVGPKKPKQKDPTLQDEKPQGLPDTYDQERQDNQFLKVPADLKKAA